jgi:hypothetical protein
MGERPLNSLADPHPWKGAAQGKLSKASKKIQGRGWWFNLELLTVSPNIVDSYIYLPGDTLNVHTESHFYVMRADRLFNLEGGTYVFTKPVLLEVIREVPFEDLPSVAQDYIEAAAVLSFQDEYDGDSTKTRQITNEYTDARVAFNKEATIAAKMNMITNNPRLTRLKLSISRIRSGIRS